MVSQIAREMVTRYGFSMLGPMALEQEGGEVFLGRDWTRPEHSYSNNTATQIDAVVQQIARDALKQAIDLLTPRRPLMDALVEALIEQETLDEISFNKIVQAHEKDFSPQQPLAQCSPHPQR
jgi:cell division protease FtsH